MRNAEVLRNQPQRSAPRDRSVAPQRLLRVACNTLLACGVLLAAAPSQALAEEVSSDASARAAALFSDGAELMEAGKVAEACPKFEAAVTLTRRTALGGMLSLADCYAEAGRVATAWGLYGEVFTKASAAGQSERAREAESKGNALSPKVPRLVLRVPEELETLQASVWINGLEQPRAGLASSIPLDYGTSVIEVRAANRETVRAEVVVRETDREIVFSLPVPTLASGPASTSKPIEPAPRPSSFWSTGRFVGLGIGGVGVATAIAGFVVAGGASSDYDAGLARGGCSGEPLVCDDLEPIESARTLGDVATGLLVGGLGVAVTGTLVFVLSGDETPTASAVALHVSPNAVRIEVPVW